MANISYASASRCTSTRPYENVLLCLEIGAVCVPLALAVRQPTACIMPAHRPVTCICQCWGRTKFGPFILTQRDMAGQGSHMVVASLPWSNTPIDVVCVIWSGGRPRACAGLWHVAARLSSAGPVTPAAHAVTKCQLWWRFGLIPIPLTGRQ
jgi:hypothetical protein